jgi:hypothetical protein
VTREPIRIGGGGLELYILAEDGRTPLEVQDVLTWGRWRATHDVHAAYNEFGHEAIGVVRISTVFLGINAGLYGKPPRLWETMIFGGIHDGWQKRATTYDDARTNHREAVALATSQFKALLRDIPGA